MKEFNVDRFLSDILVQRSGVDSLPSLVTDIVIQSDDNNIVSSSAAYLNIVFDYLKAKHSFTGRYTDYYEINAYDNATGTGSDHIVMNEHGFMDSPGGTVITGSPLENAIQATSPLNNVYLYIIDEILV